MLATNITRFFWVCLAGAMGTGARYVVGLIARRWAWGAAFPWATLAVNVVGCFLMSLVAYASAKRLISADTRATLATGFLGGLTTYSAFNWETLALLRDGAWKMGLLNVGATVIGCMAAGVLGLAFARAVVGG